MPSQVYFLQLKQIEKIKDLLPPFQEPLGVKVHFGEPGNVTYVPAQYIREITAGLVGATLIEANVLYRSPRGRAETHKQVAIEHGFDFLPIDITDGETGDDYTEIKINGQHFKTCYLGKGLDKYKSLLVISHFKGHGGSGFGGALKNIGMGLGSRRGKLAMHSMIKHHIKKEKCISCGSCIANCPVNAIAFDDNKKAFINEDVCISCSKCISVCPVQAVQIPWGGAGKKELQERIAEYALAAQQGKQCFYVNFLINITDACDCAGVKMAKLTGDIGILASTDPVAIDQASYDLVIKEYKEFENHSADDQLRHGEELGLGNREYELINL